MGEGHLTEEQFGELIAASAKGAGTDTAPAESHLQDCGQCASELASLRECLTLYREASTAYADRELRRIPPVKLPARRPLLFPVLESAYWAAAAAAIFLAALLPMQTLYRRANQPAPAVAAGAANASVGSESDEALLDDVNREESASVPVAMQALEDPSGSTASAGVETSNQTSDQRKD
jgi:anti-sigma factor RsiW